MKKTRQLKSQYRKSLKDLDGGMKARLGIAPSRWKRIKEMLLGFFGNWR